MSGADRIFEHLREGSLEREAQKQTQQASFEETVIKRLLRAAGAGLRLGQARRDAWSTQQATKLTFPWFHEQYPRFPVLLGASRLPYTATLRVGQLFGSGFMKLPWVKEYEMLCAQMDWNVQRDRAGLIFNMPHASQAAIMVLHNQPIQAQNVLDPERRTEPETRILRPFGHPRVVFVLESLNSFLDTVGTDWATE